MTLKKKPDVLIFLKRPDKHSKYEEIYRCGTGTENEPDCLESSSIIANILELEKEWSKFDASVCIYLNQTRTAFHLEYKPKRKRRINYQTMWEQWKQTFSNVNLRKLDFY